jgi:catechol 2,3-dioxygenase-like lactoylglutathione lyase family enzyme
MKLEHAGITVSDPAAFTDWYCQHLGFRVMRQMPTAPFTTFIADASGSVMLEIYRHAHIQLFDYPNQDPLLLHFAFEVGEEPIEAVAERLLAAGASVYSPLAVTPSGDQLIMLRDPWGLAIQLAHRGKSML